MVDEPTDQDPAHAQDQPLREDAAREAEAPGGPVTESASERDESSRASPQNASPASMATSQHDKRSRAESQFTVDTKRSIMTVATVYTVAEKYSAAAPHRCPCRCALMGLVTTLVIVAAGLATMPVEIETDFDAFMKTDINVSTQRDGFLAALQFRQQDEGRRLMDLFKLYDFHVVYEVDNDAIGQLGEIQKLEQQMRQLPAWQELCAEVHPSYKRLCNPGVSLAVLAQPTLTTPKGDVVPESMLFDGEGTVRQEMGTVLRLADMSQIRQIVFPQSISRETDPEKVKSGTTVLRSSFRWQFLCCTTMDGPAELQNFLGTFDPRWEKFIKETLLPFLEKKKEEKGNSPTLRIYYDGTGLQTMEVMQTLQGDVWFAGGSMVFVFVYLMIHTKSFFLSLVGILVIFLSIPLAYVFFALIAGTTSMSIASLLSLFLIVGLGSDVVFVYTDFWRHSQTCKDNDLERLAWTYTNGAKATLATSVTTAISFFANMASIIKPLREFGCFMGLCVVFVWLLLTIIYVPLCVVDDKYFGGLRARTCCSWGGGGGSGGVMTSIAGCVKRRRKSCLLVPVFSGIVLAIWAGASVKTDTGVPSIFPEDHNQHRNTAVLANFQTPEVAFLHTFEGLPESANICDEAAFVSTDDVCPLFWCETEVAGTADAEVAQEGSCKCRRQDLVDCADDAVVLAEMRFIGRQISAEELNGPVKRHMLQGKVGLSPVGPPTLRQMAPTLLNDWESGQEVITTTMEAYATYTRLDNYSSCGWQELCFCDGSHVCKEKPEWTRSMVRSTLRLQDPVTRLLLTAPDLGENETFAFFDETWLWENETGSDDGPGELDIEPWNNDENLLVLPMPEVSRRLEGNLAASMRASVDVVFGLEVDTSSPILGGKEPSDMWSFQSSYQARQPWAQRNMYTFCTTLPAKLLVQERRCWMEDFRDFALQTGERFPLPALKFDDLMQTFAIHGISGATSSKNYLWLRDGDVMASFNTFTVGISQHAETQLALHHQELWDEHIKLFNYEASRFVKGAWHTSGLWVRAEAQAELISSTGTMLFIVIFLAGVGMLMFTRDLLLSLYVVLATIFVVIGLAWFITVLMGWPIGAIEVIALIVFIGYAVTYSLHIAHKYGSDEAEHKITEGFEDLSGNDIYRYQRTTFALQSIGAAALGSAVTTAGCSVFLLFCTLTIFKKLGAVVLAVTLMSIFTALIPLPAALMMLGPARPGFRSCPRPEDATKLVQDCTAMGKSMYEAAGAPRRQTAPPEAGAAGQEAASRQPPRIPTLQGLGPPPPVPGGQRSAQAAGAAQPPPPAVQGGGALGTAESVATALLSPESFAADFEDEAEVGSPSVQVVLDRGGRAAASACLPQSPRREVLQEPLPVRHPSYGHGSEANSAEATPQHVALVVAAESPSSSQVDGWNQGFATVSSDALTPVATSPFGDTFEASFSLGAAGSIGCEHSSLRIGPPTPTPSLARAQSPPKARAPRIHTGAGLPRWSESAGPRPTRSPNFPT
eukprot:TRINITY_DN41972_c0_g1_i1.p1 TRINITY_DN41972_c0_g1~~TRINITY_DN41972_c0_g1_i1.p1  ORF type:complete len:1498 (+),score=339.93 TRINITY_DN41972_c0_g1_i1:169-4662(+)